MSLAQQLASTCCIDPPTGVVGRDIRNDLAVIDAGVVFARCGGRRHE
jgi:hypothetical protein